MTVSAEKLKCPKCGAVEFRAPSSEPEPKTELKCSRCGHKTTQEKLAADLVAKKLKDSLKKLGKGFRVKP